MLFAREAQRIRPGFDVARHAAEIERMARASGGSPLALKLAATQSRWNDVATLVRELERGARVSVSPLDASLHAWLEPVWTRLSPAQRQALAALSLLPGAFDMSDAIAIAGTSSEVVESLIDNSLVDADQSHPPRLRLHALVRVFAGTRLDQSPPARRIAIARCVARVNGRLAPPGTATPIVVSSEVAAAHVDELLAAWPLGIEIVEIDALTTFVSALLSWHESRGEFRAGERRRSSLCRCGSIVRPPARTR